MKTRLLASAAILAGVLAFNFPSGSEPADAGQLWQISNRSGCPGPYVRVDGSCSYWDSHRFFYWVRR